VSVFFTLGLSAGPLEFLNRASFLKGNRSIPLACRCWHEACFRKCV